MNDSVINRYLATVDVRFFYIKRYFHGTITLKITFSDASMGKSKDLIVYINREKATSHGAEEMESPIIRITKTANKALTVRMGISK